MGEITNERNIKVLAEELQKMRANLSEVQAEVQHNENLVHQLQEQVNTLRGMLVASMTNSMGSGPTVGG